ncbi:EF-hand domain-containing protein [Polaromonas eurypsychrophila]|uniref:EF-hand domain-containing protein n=1 Tax=Polaromonas eurypsychrophila TaxID=1614635 RepID=A0A916SDY9_9BURK|nr:EF-hand domain-containing protein [Polaromonas eurypsychrophila]GGA95840.1 hypothetical protein GCM10011496_16280 [Polaromonas eurypsychrophila]
MTFLTDCQPPSSARAGSAPLVGLVNPHSGKIVAPTLFVLGNLFALGTAVVLFGASAQAQTPQPASATAQIAAAAAASTERKYTVAQIAQAFRFIDGNKDSKISRDEAAGFRGVARHFDEADANKDGVLSRQEFESALATDKNR